LPGLELETQQTESSMSDLALAEQKISSSATWEERITVSIGMCRICSYLRLSLVRRSEIFVSVLRIVLNSHVT